MRHFNMALIHNELTKSGLKDVTPSAIWQHLETLYNLDVANQIETAVPKAMEDGETEFSLPKKDFQSVMSDITKSGALSVEASKPEKPEKPAATETPKAGSKRPTRSTPGSSSSKRRK